jgi:hypothetical protein
VSGAYPNTRVQTRDAVQFQIILQPFKSSFERVSDLAPSLRKAQLARKPDEARREARANGSDNAILEHALKAQWFEVQQIDEPERLVQQVENHELASGKRARSQQFIQAVELALAHDLPVPQHDPAGTHEQLEWRDR